MRCTICGRERPGGSVSATERWVQRPDGQWSLVEAADYCNDNEECLKAVGALPEEDEPDASDS